MIRRSGSGIGNGEREKGRIKERKGNRWLVGSGPRNWELGFYSDTLLHTACIRYMVHFSDLDIPYRGVFSAYLARSEAQRASMDRIPAILFSGIHTFVYVQIRKLSFI